MDGGRPPGKADGMPSKVKATHQVLATRYSTGETRPIYQGIMAECVTRIKQINARVEMAARYGTTVRGAATILEACSYTIKPVGWKGA